MLHLLDVLGLTKIIIPNSIVSIGNSAFDGCYALTKVYTNNLRRYGNAFKIKTMKKNGTSMKYNGKCEIHKCAICYNNFEENDDIFVLECFRIHCFHNSCIEKIEDKCPICLHPIECSPSDLKIKFSRYLT